ncbi:acyl-CoA dehydrogenase family protein [Martelella mediterranea]|uniref:acyl-CoA dehydrogenase family protein n=1 Tax=Martelella mediterranea TaxID=293089 RepID=UPI001E3E604C|nr:acyl-CoA dehydrogenase family protein [Martelella mediterranea]MCD1633125.1 acyl-CoA dehydrogenase family protein [Martelella mediterranea]
MGKTEPSGGYLSKEDQQFREEMRTFFQENIPAEIRAKVSAGQPLAKQNFVTSQRILNAHGLAVPNWPLEWGGRDWTPVQRYLYIEELQFNAVPLPLQFNCFMVGPVIAAFGNQAQKEKFLPRAANLDDWWCQGFSEPNAGSDLASLTTRAVRDGDDYIVNGQKAWTSYGQYANWIFCLVRTDFEAKKQRGISFLLIELDTPGVEMRPIITMDGRHEVNEVFFTDARVPAENLVGEENRGWDYAKFLLANERSGIARIGLSKERVARIRRRAQDNGVWDDPLFRSEVIKLEIELKALEVAQMQILARAGESQGRPDPASSILKLRGSQLQQRASELLMELEGVAALRAPGDVADPYLSAEEDLAAAAALNNYLNFRKVSIYGGSNEIQKNIIAKTILNL